MTTCIAQSNIEFPNKTQVQNWQFNTTHRYGITVQFYHRYSNKGTQIIKNLHAYYTLNIIGLSNDIEFPMTLKAGFNQLFTTWI